MRRGIPFSSSWALLGVVMVTSWVWASIPAQSPEFRLAARSDAHQVEIRALAPEGRRFNLRAPMVLEVEGAAVRRLEPTESSDLQLLFMIPARLKAPLRVSAYLCDESGAACEKRTVSALWQPDGRKLMIRSSR
jgi:hypothetical protein